MTYGEVLERFPELERLWWSFDPKLSFPDGESLEALLTRVECFADTLKNHCPAETVLIIGHGGSLRALMYCVGALELSAWWDTIVDLGSLTVLEANAEGATILLLNDLSHLEGEESHDNRGDVSHFRRS